MKAFEPMTAHPADLQARLQELQAKLAAAEAALDESRNRFRTIVCNAQAVIFVLDQDGIFELSEGLGLRLLGLSPGQVVGLSALDLYAGYPVVLDGIRRALKGEVARSVVEFPGGVFDVLYSPRHDATGQRSGVIGLATDITERTRAEQALARRADELSSLNELAGRVSASLSTDATIEAGIGGVLAATGCDLAFLFLRDGDRLVLGALGPEQQARSIVPIPEHRVGTCLCGLAVSEARAIFSRDIHCDARCTMHECRNAGFTSFAAIPLRSNQEVVGALGLASRQPYDFEERSAFLETLAGTLSTAVVNAQLYEAARRHAEDLEKNIAERHRVEVELRKAQVFASTLTAISQAFLTLQGDNELYASVLDCILDATTSPGGFIGYLSPAGDLVCAAVRTSAGDRPPAPLTLPPDLWRNTGWGEAIAHGTPLLQNDSLVPSGHLPVQRCLVAPITLQRQAIGVIVVGNRATDYIAEDLERLERIAEHVAPVLDARLERGRSERELRESEARLNESQRIARIGHIMFDVNSATWTASPALADILGLPTGKSFDLETWYATLPPEEVDAMRRYLQDEVLGKSRQFDREYRVRRVSDGAIRWVHGIGTADYAPDGKPLRVFGTIQDVTERKTAELEHERLQAQLLQAQKMESVGRLAGGVAHDFNNMLLAILGNVSLALEQVSEGYPLREYLEEIQTAAERSARLTRQLLAFARKQTVNPRPLDLNEAVGGTLRMLQRLIGEQVQLVWRPGASLWTVEIDPVQVDQVLANLTVNARDAIGSGGVITIETANVVLDLAYASAHPECTPGDYVMLRVSDTGPGIDASIREHLFEPFFTTKELGHGTGLGLATVFGIVKQNLGQIDVTSEPGHGASFAIYLPRAVRAAAETEAAATAAPARGTETVLIAEDEEQVLSLGRRILERSGYHVLAARSPAEAVALAEASPGTIRLLVSDVVMPGMNGKDLRDEVAKWQPGIRCIFMSGYPADVIAHQGVLEPGVEFLQKPFSAATLTRKVRGILDE